MNPTGQESSQSSELRDFALSTVHLAARALGLSPETRDDRVRLGARGLSARCVILSVDERPGGSAVGLGIEIEVEPETGGSRRRTLRNRTTGVGRSAEEAVLQAVQVLIEGGLPPILTGLAASPSTALWSGATTTPDGRAEVMWDAFAGPLQVAGRARAALREQLESEPIFGLYGSPTAFGERELSWLQTSMYRGDDGAVSLDCVLDGRPWTAGQEALRSFTWPSVSGILFVRQFHLIRARLSG